MTLADVKGITDWRYSRECDTRGIPEKTIGDGEFKQYYNQVVEELFRELNITDLSTTINLSPVTVYTEYALPASYGGYRGHELVFSGQSYGNTNLQLTPHSKMPVSGDLVSGMPNRISIFAKADGLYYVYLYPLSSMSGTLTIKYKYSAEIGAGEGSGAGLTGTVDVPRPYLYLLYEGILALLFPDKQADYYARLDNALLHRPIPTSGEIPYNIGGLNDDEIDNGLSKNFNGEV